jgi:hypothetical protein
VQNGVNGHFSPHLKNRDSIPLSDTSAIPIAAPGEQLQRLPGPPRADLAPAVVELHQDLRRPETALQEIGEHRVLGALDVHLDHVGRRQVE